jgi:ribosomal-protein-alanine N-acetyltransferase
MGESDMMNVAVHPDYRRKGYAEALVLALCDELKERGNTTLALEVRASNEPAKALYEKLGFTLAGRRPNYYRNPREDALILKKAL